MKTKTLPFQTFEDLAKRDSIHLAQAGSTVIARYGSVTVADLDMLLLHQLGVARAHGGKMTMISLVEVGTNVDRISDDVKHRSVENMNKLGKACIGSATVVLGGGLSATMIRMFMAGLQLVSRTPFPQKAFSSLPETLSWVQNLPGQNPDVHRLTSVVIAKHFGLSSTSSNASGEVPGPASSAAARGSSDSGISKHP